MQERELCASARMLPGHYLAVKAAMLRETARRGVLPRSEARTMFRLDSSRALKVSLKFILTYHYRRKLRT
jgi:transcriptional adapter 2-alpha